MVFTRSNYSVKVDISILLFPVFVRAFSVIHTLSRVSTCIYCSSSRRLSINTSWIHGIYMLECCRRSGE